MKNIFIKMWFKFEMTFVSILTQRNSIDFESNSSISQVKLTNSINYLLLTFNQIKIIFIIFEF